MRHLRAVCAIAEAGSLTRAAAALRLTQPNLTAQLQRIEKMLGGPLFTRSAQGAAPTALGELVLSRARAVLPAFDDLKNATSLVPAQNPTMIRLGTTAGPLVSGIIGRMRELVPGAEVTAKEERCSTRLMELVHSGHIELAIFGDSPGFELVPRPGIVLHPVVTEPLFALLPASHPLAALDEIPLDKLVEVEWTLPPRDDDRTFEYYLQVLDKHGLRPRVAHQVEGSITFDLIRDAGVATLCQATCREHPGVAVRPIAGDPLWYRHVLAWHANGPLACHAGKLAEMAALAYAEAIPRSPIYPAWLAGRAEVGLGDARVAA